MAFAFVKNDTFSEYEITNERASYRTIVNDLIGDIVLCNNICSIDERIYDYMDWDIDEHEIYQFYLCNVSEYNVEKARECGLLLTYSDMLECDVLCVDHYGTSWDYVLTDAPIFDTYEEWEEYMCGNKA